MKQILVFVLLITLITWMMFSPIYRTVYISKKVDLQKEVDYLLEVGTRLGYISPAMIEESKARLYRFNPSELIYTITSESGLNPYNPSAPLQRGDSLTVEISYPTKNLFRIDRLIGIASDETIMIVGKATQMVEYVNP